MHHRCFGLRQIESHFQKLRYSKSIMIICRGMCAEREIMLCVATNPRSQSMKSVKQRVLQKITRPETGIIDCEGWWSEMRASNEAVVNGQYIFLFQSYVTSLLKSFLQFELSSLWQQPRCWLLHTSIYVGTRYMSPLLAYARSIIISMFSVEHMSACVYMYIQIFYKHKC